MNINKTLTTSSGDGRELITVQMAPKKGAIIFLKEK